MRKSKTRRGRYSKVFHSVRSKLLELWSNLKHQARQSFVGGGVNQSRIDSYTNVTDNVDTNAHNNSNSNLNLKQHDTDSKKQLVKTYQNSVVKRIFNLTKKAEGKKTNTKLHILPRTNKRINQYGANHQF